MGCLSSGDLKEEKALFALVTTLYRIGALSSRKWVVVPFRRQFSSQPIPFLLFGGGGPFMLRQR